MLKRSFYMRSDVAARLTALIEDLHYLTRQARHEVLAAMAAVAEEHKPEIEQRLRQGSPQPGRQKKDGASR